HSLGDRLQPLLGQAARDRPRRSPVHERVPRSPARGATLVKLEARRGPMSEINVTPLVDVVLVLLIIFMVTAPFLQGGLEVDVPKVATRGLDVREGLIVSVRRDRTVAIGDRVVPLDGFEQALKQAGGEQRPVYL